jgi:hypothetical protein
MAPQSSPPARARQVAQRRSDRRAARLRCGAAAERRVRGWRRRSWPMATEEGRPTMGEAKRRGARVSPGHEKSRHGATNSAAAHQAPIPKKSAATGVAGAAGAVNGRLSQERRGRAHPSGRALAGRQILARQSTLKAMRLEAKARIVVESALEADVRIAIVGRADDPCVFAWAPTAPTVLKAARLRAKLQARRLPEPSPSRPHRRRAWGHRMIRVVGIRPHPRNTLRAFVDLELTRVGFVLRDCAWHSRATVSGCRFPPAPIKATTAQPAGRR